MNRWLSAGLLLAIAAVAPSADAAQPRQQADAARQRPVEGFACTRNDLTSYTGVVIAYRRATGETMVRIRTDWDTNEQVTLRHPGTADPSPLFRIEGKPFTQADWSRIEQRQGVLLPGVRAAVWVCADGKTIVDWGVRKE
jgi:hypothetical protein